MKRWAAMVIQFQADDEVMKQVAKSMPPHDIEGLGTVVASYPTTNNDKPLSWYGWFRTIRSIKRQQKHVIKKGWI